MCKWQIFFCRCTVDVYPIWKSINRKKIWQYRDKKEMERTKWLSKLEPTASVQCYKVNTSTTFVFSVISAISLCDSTQDFFSFSLFDLTSSSCMWGGAQKQEAISHSWRQHCRMSTWIFSVCPLARGNGIRRKMASWIWRECGVLAKERKRIWVELRE